MFCEDYTLPKGVVSSLLPSSFSSHLQHTEILTQVSTSPCSQEEMDIRHDTGKKNVITEIKYTELTNNNQL